ncbi:MAG TPA: 2-hydroxyacyl-CoA dehydratase family protein [Bacillota bacterium]|nr:2-hydroxyacyl-CoA dehydratase family protein [Bacillota bacterium]
MQEIKNYLDSFTAVAENPKAQLDAACGSGKKAVGCLTYYCPEELAYAAGMLTFGIWGSENIRISEAKKYFPAFYCSVVQTSLELGLKGTFDQLSAVMIPALCDTLKCMTQNWKVGVKNVEVIPVIHPQNRKTEAGVEFLTSQYRKIRTRLEEISGSTITDEKLINAIGVYNLHRKVMREFTEIAARYPHLISPAQRSAVIKSGYFMDKAEHAKQVAELIEACKRQPVEAWKGKKVLTTGSASILQILEENGVAVAADDVAAESRQFRTAVPVTADPIEGLAQYISLLEGCSLLYDPEKKRGEMIVELAHRSGAQGVIVLMTKLCDPEEFDYPILKEQFDAAGLPYILLEVDQQMVNYEQARTAIQAFCDIL